MFISIINKQTDYALLKILYENYKELLIDIVLNNKLRLKINNK